MRSSDIAATCGGPIKCVKQCKNDSMGEILVESDSDNGNP